MTLLTVVRDASDILTQPRKSAVFGVSTDAECRLYQTLLKQTGKELIKAHDWSFLQATESFACGSDNAQTNEPPAGFDRMQENTDMWNDSRDWRIIGPESSALWSDLQVRSVSTLPQYWRIINGVLNIFQPTDGEVIRFEYIHNKWVYAAGSTSAQGANLTADTDTFVFDEWLLTLALVFRWKRAKGFDYSEEMIDYQAYLQKAIMSDRGGTVTLSTDEKPRMRDSHTWQGSVTEAS